MNIRDGSKMGRSRSRRFLGSRLLCTAGIGTLGLAAAALATASCHDGSNQGTGSDAGSAARVIAGPVVISTAMRSPRPANASLDYWMWLPSGGDPVDGTQAQVQALKPAVLRVGGYNSDANVPDPFDDAELDKAVAYAHAVGAEPLIQVPLIADVDGRLPTAAEAAATVSYANVTQGYGVKYFAIGDEPDLYPMQGSLLDMTKPVFPGYTPADYCASVTAYAAAMKAVDPTIQIIGPQLSYKYVVGDDWLTPILTGCGSAFDILSIQRFPFSSVQASVKNASTDAVSFRALIASVRGLMTAAGYGDKPLAITGMNVAYDALPAGAVPDAAPGTVGSALWLADIVGTAQELNLWTTVVWDISDTDDQPLGLLGMPPTHTPRPEYYAYALYADHAGPTLVDVTTAPAGVSAHATRNDADDATEVIVVNWNSSSAPLAFEVTGLASMPVAPIFELPALSMAAVEIPDTGTASASVYGDAQHTAGMGPQALAPTAGSIVSGISDAGLDAPDSPDAQEACATSVLFTPTVTTKGTTTSTGPAFGSGAEAWGSFVFAGSGQPMPTLTVTADGDGFRFTGQVVTPLTNNYEGVGLYFNSMYCVDASAYTGVEFDVSGNLGGCRLAFGDNAAGDVSMTSDPSRGQCSEGSSCYGPSADITAQVAMVTDAAAPDAAAPAVTIKVPFSSESHGSPVATLDPAALVTLQWQLTGPVGGPDGGACAADLTIENVAFY